jgi:hypothetical protein
MTLQETASLLALIGAYYPDFCAEAGNDDKTIAFIVNAWRMVLQEYPAVRMQVSLLKHVKQSSVPPTIAELIRGITEKREAA